MELFIVAAALDLVLPPLTLPLEHLRNSLRGTSFKSYFGYQVCSRLKSSTDND